MRLFEIYQEYESYFSHSGRKFDLNPIFKIAERMPVEIINISQLSNNFDTSLDLDRINKADYTTPILITPYKGKYIVVDGAHRLMKAYKAHKDTVPCKIIPEAYFN